MRLLPSILLVVAGNDVYGRRGSRRSTRTHPRQARDVDVGGQSSASQARYGIRRARELPLVSAAVLRKEPRRAVLSAESCQEKLPFVERLAPRSMNWRMTLRPSTVPVMTMVDRALAGRVRPFSDHFWP